MTDGKKISVTVRTRKGVENRSRAGHNFVKEPKTVLVTAEGLKAIKADPRLNILPDSDPKPIESGSRSDAKAKDKQKK